MQRAPRNLVAEFRGIPVPNIADRMNRFYCADPGIKMVNGGSGLRLAGSALTVHTRADDNLMVHKAIAMAQPGDVIIINASRGMQNALLGGLMSTAAWKRGVAGFVVDGCVRDLDYLRGLDFPVFARGIAPKGPYHCGPGSVNVPISCGGVIVNPGDIIVGDDDGFVVVPLERAEQILKEAKELLEKETKMINGMLDGTITGTPWDPEWIDKTLKELGCTIVE